MLRDRGEMACIYMHAQALYCIMDMCDCYIYSSQMVSNMGVGERRVVSPTLHHNAYMVASVPGLPRSRVRFNYAHA